MNSWRKRVEEYVELRRSLGFKLLGREGGLDQFRLVSPTGGSAVHITIPLAMEWAQQDQDCAPCGMGQAAQFRTRVCAPLERS